MLACALGIALVAALAVPVPQAAAQEARIALADGAWRGTMGAAGVLTESGVDGTMIWQGHLDGAFLFSVTSGSIIGAWSWEGDADVNVSTPEGEVWMSLESVATGVLEGAADQLRLVGEETTTAFGGFMGMVGGVEPNTTRLEPIDVRFVEVGCNAVFGDWTTSLNEQALEGAVSGGLTGWFVATPIGPTLPGAGIVAELEERYADLELRVLTAIAGGGQQLLTTGGLLDVFDLLEEAVRLETEAGELDATCAYRIEGGPFAHPLTSLIGTLTIRMVDYLDASQQFSAAQVLVAVGAAGGSASRTLADTLEAAIAKRAQELHDLFVDTTGSHPDGRACSSVDPCVRAPGEVLQLHLAASLLGFTLTVDGLPVGPELAVGGGR